MLNINMEDVAAIVQLLLPYLIAAVVALVVGLVVIIAVRKRRKPQRIRVRGVAVIGVVLTLGILANLVAFGPMATILNLMSGSGTVNAETTQEAEDVAARVAGEGIVLMQNDAELLPLGKGKVNLFGWASANPVYGGSGSGSINNLFPKVSLIDGFEQAGLEVNSELTDFYNGYSSDRPEMSIERQSWTLPEPPVADYSQELMDSAKSFSDVAVVSISRMAGEGHTDMPLDVSKVAYDNNSTEYADFEPGEHYLQLSRTEADMVDLVAKNFEKIVLVYNSANPMELDFVADTPQIKSVLWAPGPGNVGFEALGQIVAGDINPSGHAADTFIYDMTTAPWWNNQKKRAYENMTHLTVEGMSFGKPETFQPSFIHYNDGIYVGYKYYETAATEGLIKYDDVVQYPFGHGLSYTSFTQEMGAVTRTETAVTFQVSVTNTGEVAGKDAVQVYVNPPYTDGGIEKSSANLVTFAKTDVLKPGASQTIDIEIPIEDLASYDVSGKGAYVIEAGDYSISVNADSHSVLDSETVTVDSTIRYEGDNPRPSDDVAAVNLFGEAAGNFTTLSRQDGFANHAEAVAAPTDLVLAEPFASQYHVNKNADLTAFLNPEDEMPTTGADNGLELAEFRGAAYDDPRWDDLLDQLKVEEMMQLTSLSGYQTPAVASVGKVATVDSDGPAAINNNFTGQGSTGFPVAVMIASTFNPELANDYGRLMGKMARELGSAGWYAPGVNMHRIAFGARNYEYFSEDAVLSGMVSAEAVNGADSEGVYSYVKHFALYDFNGKMTSVWAGEQAIREIYLKPFEISVKEGHTGALMESWSYIGNKWSGEWSELNNDVLRGEWGFEGFVLTDFFRNNGHGFMTADLALANGVDGMLSTFEGGPNNVADPSAPTTVKQLRQASKNIMFTVVNSWAYDGESADTGMPGWKIIAFIVDGLLLLLLIGFGTLQWRRARKAEAQA